MKIASFIPLGKIPFACVFLLGGPLVVDISVTLRAADPKTPFFLDTLDASPPEKSENQIVQPNDFSISDSQTEESSKASRPISEQALRLHAESIVIDGHNDLPWKIRTEASSDFAKLDIRQRQPKLQTDIPRLREGGVGAQFWSVYVPVDYAYQGSALLTTIEQIDLVKAMVKRYPEDFELAMTVADIRRIHAQGRIASLIGVEGGHSIENSISSLNHLFDLGARYMTLTHSDSLDWADSATDKAKANGLSPFGKEVVQRMNTLGMLVDLSHVSPETTHAVLNVSQAPVIFSHSSAQAVANSARNVPDDVLRRLREKDGVVMVNYYSAFVVPEAAKIYQESLQVKRKLAETLEADEVSLRMARWWKEHPMPAGTIEIVLDHIDHLTKAAGWQHVGIGSDFDGISLLPEGLEDVSTYPAITQGLLDRQYTEEQIKGILGENLLRVLEKAEQTSKQLSAK